MKSRTAWYHVAPSNSRPWPASSRPVRPRFRRGPIQRGLAGIKPSRRARFRHASTADVAYRCGGVRREGRSVEQPREDAGRGAEGNNSDVATAPAIGTAGRLLQLLACSLVESVPARKRLTTSRNLRPRRPRARLSVGFAQSLHASPCTLRFLRRLQTPATLSVHRPERTKSGSSTSDPTPRYRWLIFGSGIASYESVPPVATSESQSLMGRAGIEPATPGFSVLCSTS